MDGLRGVLAVYVVLGHALPFTDLPGWVRAPFHHGEAAVDLFFALSGLVVVNSLERFSGRFWPFMRARGRRLLPVYFVVLGLAVVVVLAGDPVRAMPWVGAAGAAFWSAGLPAPFAAHFLAHLFLVQGVIPQGVLPFAYVTLLGPAWSLSTEWQFYVVVGLCAAWRLEVLALAFLVVGAVYHLLPDGGYWSFSRAFLPDAAPYFALGLATLSLQRGGGPRVFAICLFGACGIGCLSGVEKALPPLVWLVVVLAQRARWGAVLERAPVLWLGAVSYPLYLLNEPVQRGLALVIAPLANGNGDVFTAVWLPLAVLGPVVAAAVLHHEVEQKFLRGKKVATAVAR
jgi:peptidoglycan/LPS O-acetylase OafA/YrhL